MLLLPAACLSHLPSSPPVQQNQYRPSLSISADGSWAHVPLSLLTGFAFPLLVSGLCTLGAMFPPKPSPNITKSVLSILLVGLNGRKIGCTYACQKIGTVLWFIRKLKNQWITWEPKNKFTLTFSVFYFIINTKDFHLKLYCFYPCSLN